MSMFKAAIRAKKKRRPRNVYNPRLPSGDLVSDLTGRQFLEAFGSVQDNRTKRQVPFKVDTVNPQLAGNILDYFDNPGVTIDGLPKWNIVVSGRQSTKSTVATYGLVALASRDPGAEAFIIADTATRSEYLYDRAAELHGNLHPRIRTPLAIDGTRKRMVFDSKIGGKLGFYSAERRGGMVGFSGKLGQISEIPFMQDPGRALSVLLPALYHQSDSRLVLESTPAPPSFNGAHYWKNIVLGAISDPESRFKVFFSPFWESNLNRNIWVDSWKPTNAETRLMEEFGDQGLTWENLAFRRQVMRTDDEIRRNPDLFEVWYPFSLTTCWGGGNVGLFPDNVLKAHVKAARRDRHRGIDVCPTDRVIIGVDPAGLLGGADHAAFTVMGCNQEEWTLQEVYSSSVTVHELVDELMGRAQYYRGVTGDWPDIGVESNGVGAATLALLVERGYPNIYHEANYRPGITATRKKNAKFVAETCDALMDRLKPLWSLPLTMQLQSYSGDRDKRTGEVSMLINGLAKGRRERMHWDLASSFQIACHMGHHLVLPRKAKPPSGAVSGAITGADILPGVWG